MFSASPAGGASEDRRESSVAPLWQGVKQFNRFRINELQTFFSQPYVPVPRGVAGLGS